VDLAFVQVAHLKGPAPHSNSPEGLVFPRTAIVPDGSSQPAVAFSVTSVIFSDAIDLHKLR